MPVDEILRVPYNIPGSQNWQWLNIYTRLSQERIIFLNQPVTMGVANSIISALLYLESEDNTKPIYLYINSLGDPVLAGMADETAGLSGITASLAIYDTFQHIKSEVITICLGQAVGVAVMLLSAGTKGKRVSLPNAMITLMQPYVGTQGQATDIQLSVQEALNKRNIMMQILAENTGQSVETLHRDMDRAFYLTPTEAQAYGLIDRVLDNR
ncbi:ATP-dependent Clp protease proteolytic subunit [Leptolyngbya sp. PCC 6406]|uniref:ATP-dependent Clp protease proteolytic subunit n=1 Tax=Leptolyngbya sp. PCC 6406 TaxID=1173264 RepID=UPI0002ACDB07|nr:ATP-dependent Clp protease proteolytic subunit [Leptolyngbya sp. PCC 6406]